MPLNCHIMVRKTAESMAQELFEVYARDDKTYKALKADGRLTEKLARKRFVARVAPKLYEDARQALVEMLAQPDDRVPVSMKEEIAEALILDNACRANRLVDKERAVVPEYLN